MRKSIQMQGALMDLVQRITFGKDMVMGKRSGLSILKVEAGVTILHNAFIGNAPLWAVRSVIQRAWNPTV